VGLSIAEKKDPLERFAAIKRVRVA